MLENKFLVDSLSGMNLTYYKYIDFFYIAAQLKTTLRGGEKSLTEEMNKKTEIEDNDW